MTTYFRFGSRGGHAKPANNLAGRNTARPGVLTAARLKVVTTLDATELAALPAPDDKPRVSLRIRLPNRTLTAEIAAKSLRKAQTAIREAGIDNVVLQLQGRLVSDTIAEAGLSAQPRAAKPAPQ